METDFGAQKYRIHCLQWHFMTSKEMSLKEKKNDVRTQSHIQIMSDQIKVLEINKF